MTDEGRTWSPEETSGKNYPENITVGYTRYYGSPTRFARHNTLAAIGVKRIFSELKVMDCCDPGVGKLGVEMKLRD